MIETKSHRSDVLLIAIFAACLAMNDFGAVERAESAGWASFYVVCGVVMVLCSLFNLTRWFAASEVK